MSDAPKKSQSKKLSAIGLSLMIFTAIYGFGNITRANFMMGYGAIPWYLIGAILFFLPFAFMVTELGSTFRKEKGGIYSWMEKSVGPTYAFIGTFMWYAAWIIWMMSGASSAMVTLVSIVSGNSDHLPPPWVMSLVGIAWMLITTALASHGLGFIKKIAAVGGIAVISLNGLLLVCVIAIFIANGHPATPLTWHSLTTSASPNFDNGSLISFFAFMVFAVFAYGGVEAIGGLVDETENPKRNFPRGVIGSAIIIAVGYSVMILLMGFYLNYQSGGSFWEGIKSGKINLGNAGLMSMHFLGSELGHAFGMSSAAADMLGGIFVRYMATAGLVAYLGAFFTILYSPVKQIISGTPEKLWPGRYGKIDEKSGMPKFAIKVQLIIVLAIIFINMAINLGGGPAASKKFFLILTNMTNVSTTIPFLFIIFAFGKFRLNDKIEKPFNFFKTKTIAVIAVCIAFAVVAFSNVFTIIEPITQYLSLPLDKRDAALGDTIQTVATMIGGPAIFAIAAAVIMQRYKRKNPVEYAALSDFTPAPEEESSDSAASADAASTATGSTATNNANGELTDAEIKKLVVESEMSQIMQDQKNEPIAVKRAIDDEKEGELV